MLRGVLNLSDLICSLCSVGTEYVVFQYCSSCTSYVCNNPSSLHTETWMM